MGPSLFWSFQVLYSLLLCINSVSSNKETDQLSLIAFKNYVKEDPSNALSSWNRSTHYCQWLGITCNKKHHRVASIVLTNLNLVGTIAPHIANLTFLKVINLRNNNFHGEIPSEIGGLFRLQYIFLSYNSLGGAIPANLSQCRELIYFVFDFNQFVGELPYELSFLPKLSGLRAEKNGLTGTIPRSYGNISSLNFLVFSQNMLSGGIPNELGQLTNLEMLILDRNTFSSTIPSSIFNLTQLYEFSVTDCLITGSLPSDIGLTLPNLVGLFIGVNQMSGPIPVSLSNATYLVQLDLSYNYFTGSVPNNLGNLKNLVNLNLGFNELVTSIADEMSFLTSLTNCSVLQKLSLNFNSLTGELPHSITNLSTTLQYLSLATNQLSGKIPTGVENLIGLVTLELSQNSFSGVIPPGIGRLSNLNLINLSENRLSGQISTSIGNMTSLIELHLDGNQLSGSIPLSLSQCTHLLVLNFSQNNLSGNIPKQLLEISSLSVYLNLSGNSLTGPLPSEVGNLKNLGKIDISDNKLSGEIPSTLGNCLSLELLNMAGNSFQGSIPSSLGDLRALKELDLSRNNLSGLIPEFLGDLSSLQYLNLSFNHFEGEVPKNGAFSNESAISLFGNDKLCGGISQLRLPSCAIIEASKKRKIPFHLKIIIPALIAGLILICCSFAIFLWRKKSRKKTSPTFSLEEKYKRVAYAELLKATNGFSTSNLMGVGSFGSVYKGTLEGDETILAVKVLDLQQRGALKSFMVECKALRNIRHRNLLRIITSCSSIDFKGNDFKALVFEFMPNGSLEEWLHPEHDGQGDQLRKLKFRERLDIAVDVASALEYLHHQCQRQIIHCDLKPSNVLLDHEMTAHVGDFGLARILRVAGDSSSMNQSSTGGLKGSIGYIAPEYGMGGEASTHGDVYSYGVLLLEMFTGKRPTDDIFKEGFNLHNLAKIAMPDRVLEIIDPIMFEEEEMANIDARLKIKECLALVLAVGISCSAEMARERLEMREIVCKMHSIRDFYLSVIGRVQFDEGTSRN